MGYNNAVRGFFVQLMYWVKINQTQHRFLNSVHGLLWPLLGCQQVRASLPCVASVFSFCDTEEQKWCSGCLTQYRFVLICVTYVIHMTVRPQLKIMLSTEKIARASALHLVNVNQIAS